MHHSLISPVCAWVCSYAAAAKSLQSCPTLRPHRRQPTRLPRPWDSPGKNTGVACHFLLQCRKVKSEREVAQSCLTLCNPMDCSPPGSAVHGIFQARVLEWVPLPSPSKDLEGYSSRDSKTNCVRGIRPTRPLSYNAFQTFWL